MRTPRSPRPRLMLNLDAPLIRALKVRAAEEGTRVSELVAAWVRSWAVAPARRRRRRS